MERPQARINGTIQHIAPIRRTFLASATERRDVESATLETQLSSSTTLQYDINGFFHALPPITHRTIQHCIC
jgi:hypothetical protein